MVLGQEEVVHLLEVCADNRNAEDIPTKGKERERFILSFPLRLARKNRIPWRATGISDITQLQ